MTAMSVLRAACVLAGVCTLSSALRATAPPTWENDLSPIAAEDWSYDRAAHLLERAAFGATPEIVGRFASMTPDQAVAALVDYDAIDANWLPRFEDSYVWDPGMDPFPRSHGDAVAIARERGEALGVKALPVGSPRRLQPIVDTYFYGVHANAIEVQRLGVWWANRMLSSPRPLEEALTLFWHGHFATAANTVRDARMMERQNALFRHHASGAFGQLLGDIVRDPAMLVYLENRENIRSHPNETFARALLEHFTLGAGHYTERDVREAARAFTGWTHDVLEFEFDETQHDAGEKSFLGRTGPFDGDDVIDIVLERPATAEFVAAKVYGFFVRERVSDAVRTSLGRTYRQSGYRMKPLLRQIFLSKDFHSGASVATQIKSPVALVVSTYKKMGLTELPTIPDVNQLTTSLGQTLFDPPNVGGWPGGRAWMTPEASLARGRLFREVISPDGAPFRAPDRTMPPLEARVGENLAQGMDIPEATKGASADADARLLADRDEDFDLRYASYRGYAMAFERTKPIPRRRVSLEVTDLLRRAGADTAEAAVDHLIRRFLRAPLEANGREALVARLRAQLGSNTLEPGPALEPALRELLSLILGSPEYQRR